MNKLLKFTEKSTYRNYFSSDFHLGHKRDFIFNPRGFNTWEEHTKGLIDKTNEVVKQNDNLFLTGDFCLNSSDVDFENYLGALDCDNIYMLWGNHNNPVQRIYANAIWNKYHADIEVYPFRYKNIIFVGNYLEIVIDGQYIVLMHYPIDVFNEMKNGAWMLCGHSHYNYIPTQIDSLVQKRLDIGWEGIAKPYSMLELKAIMDKKQIKLVDHHA